jgi:hypothetical protein
MRIYLDTSVLNRPFDNQTQARIHLETEAFLTVLDWVIAGRFSLINSAVLIFENDVNPFPERQKSVAEEIWGMVQEKRRLLPAELKRVGWEALVHKLGLADATRFLLEYASGSGDCVQLKEQLFAGKTVDELCDAIEQKPPKV